MMEGYLRLQKQSGTKVTWLKRYVKLTTATFSYSRTRENPKPIKSFPVTTDTFASSSRAQEGEDHASIFQFSSSCTPLHFKVS